MIPVSDDLVARIGKINVRFGALLQTMGGALAAAAGQDGGEEWGVAELRDFAHQLVALGGDLTSFGVDVARQANEVT
jgi:hypothetical protein